VYISNDASNSCLTHVSIGSAWRTWARTSVTWWRRRGTRATWRWRRNCSRTTCSSTWTSPRRSTTASSSWYAALPLLCLALPLAYIDAKCTELHVQLESLGVEPRSRAILCRPCQTLIVSQLSHRWYSAVPLTRVLFVGDAGEEAVRTSAGVMHRGQPGFTDASRPHAARPPDDHGVQRAVPGPAGQIQADGADQHAHGSRHH
jgi:hypothetical protein